MYVRKPPKLGLLAQACELRRLRQEMSVQGQLGRLKETLFQTTVKGERRTTVCGRMSARMLKALGISRFSRGEG